MVQHGTIPGWQPRVVPGELEKMRETRLDSRERDSLPNQIFMKFLPVDSNRSWHWQKPQNCPWLKYRVVWFLERFRLHGEPFMRSMGENRPPFWSSLGRFSRTKTPTFFFQKTGQPFVRKKYRVRASLHRGGLSQWRRRCTSPMRPARRGSPCSSGAQRPSLVRVRVKFRVRVRVMGR